MTEGDISTSTQHIVDIAFRGTVYNVACRKGEESRLLEFVGNINEMVSSILGAESGKSKVSDVLLLLLVCFKLLDRVEEMENAFQKIRAELREYQIRYDAEVNLRSELEEVLGYSADRLSRLVDLFKERTESTQSQS